MILTDLKDMCIDKYQSIKNCKKYINKDENSLSC